MLMSQFCVAAFVGIPHGSSMRVLDVVHHSTYEDTWHCGTPIHLVIPLAINVVLMETMASGGTLRLSTYDGHLLQDHEVMQLLQARLDEAGWQCRVGPHVTTRCTQLEHLDEADLL